jgi:hypothetical protein
MAKNSGVRVWPLVLSTSTQRYGRPGRSSTSLTLWQLPEVDIP